MLFTGVSYSHDGDDETIKKDTVSALVINPRNPLYPNISKMSGKEIINLIDSLFELDKIPNGLIK